MANGYWKFNGMSLDTANVKVKPTGANANRNIRHGVEDIHGQRQRREKIGVDITVKKVTVSFIGQGSSKWLQAQILLGMLDSEEELTITAPDGYFAMPGFTSAQFAPQNAAIDERAPDAVAKIEVTFDAYHLGSLVRDGGTYESIQPWRSDLLPNSYFAASSSSGFLGVPAIGLLPQYVNYPLGVDGSTSLDKPLSSKWSATASGDGGTATIAIYDISSVTFGTPLAKGTGGPLQLTFSPT